MMSEGFGPILKHGATIPEIGIPKPSLSIRSNFHVNYI
jgi:hypothetical protein